MQCIVQVSIMSGKFKYHKKIIYLVFLIILIGCQFQDTIKTHGIIYLENRSKALNVNKSNKNDVIKIMGQPQIKSFEDENMWIYAERVLTKGKFHRLGQNVLKENNVLALEFDKYGVLIDKKFFDKSEINKISFSEKNTVNDISKKSFVSSFLESVRQKMYENRR